MEQQEVTHWSLRKRVSTDLRHHFFSERVINIWNSLDNRTVTFVSINIFKGNLERLRQSKEIDLFVGNWCYLIFWGWAVPSGRPCPVSSPVSYIVRCIHIYVYVYACFVPAHQGRRSSCGHRSLWRWQLLYCILLTLTSSIFDFNQNLYVVLLMTMMMMMTNEWTLTWHKSEDCKDT